MARDERRIVVILNRGSGHGDAEASRAAIDAALARSGRPYKIVETAGGDALAAAARNAREEAGMVVAAGGDGTLGAVAGELVGTGVTFGAIPLGTFNYFAGNRGIPLDPTAAANVLVTGRVAPLPAMLVNGRLFLNNASVGLYRQLLEDREWTKRRLGRYRAVAAIAGLMTLLRHHASFDIHLEIDGAPQVVRTAMLFFAANTLQLEKLELPAAACTVDGEIAVLALKPMRRMALLVLALRGALAGLARTDNISSYCARTVRVERRRARSIGVAIDGETIRCTLPLTIEVRPDALRVVLPDSPEPRE